MGCNGQACMDADYPWTRNKQTDGMIQQAGGFTTEICQLPTYPGRTLEYTATSNATVSHTVVPRNLGTLCLAQLATQCDAPLVIKRALDESFF